MSNFSINKTFGLVFVVIILILFALTFVFWLGYRAGSSTVKSEVLWNHGDFSNTETSVAYAGLGTEITSETNNKLILVDEVLVESGTEYMTWICWVCPHCHNSSIHWIRLEKDSEEEIESTIEVGEMILFRHVTSGEFAREFKPTFFLEVVNTELSRCFVDDRLRISLNGEIYWIRLEKDSEEIPYAPQILKLNSYGRKVDLMWDFLLSSLQDWEDVSGNKSSEGKGNQE